MVGKDSNGSDARYFDVQLFFGMQLGLIWMECVGNL